MIVFTLALRSLARNRKSSLVLIGLVAVGVFLFILGDAILGSASGGLRQEFQDGCTGDLAIRTRFERKFGIYGFSIPTIGSYEEMPTLKEAVAISEAVKAVPGVKAVTGLVSGAALLEASGKTQLKIPVFGVMPDYFSFFPSLKFLSGAAPAGGEAWVVLPRSRATELEQAEGRTLAIGESLQFTMASGSAFTIRAVTLAGIVENPLKNSPDLAAAYTDPATLRALLGLSQGGESTESQVGSQTEDLSSFFAGEGSGATATTDEGKGARGLDLVSEYLAAPSVPTVEVDPALGSWHFLLVRLEPGVASGPVLHRVNESLSLVQPEAEAVDWLGVAGLNASILFLIKRVFEIGIGVLAGIIVLVLTNGLAFAVIEETKEIGTMRALGAQKPFVSAVYFLRALVLVVVGTSLGLVLGAAALGGLGRVGIPISNSYLLMLFGSTSLRPSFQPTSIFVALVGALAVTVVSSVYPMVQAMRTTVAQSMTAE